MGIVISRYMDPTSSESALIKFIIESIQLVHTICTADTYFPELTPWNVIDFQTDELFDTFPLRNLFSNQLQSYPLFPPSINHEHQDRNSFMIQDGLYSSQNSSFQEHHADEYTQKHDLFYYGRQDVTAVI